MLRSNQRGRGHDPVTVAGRIMSLVVVSMAKERVASGSTGFRARGTARRPEERRYVGTDTPRARSSEREKKNGSFRP